MAEKKATAKKTDAPKTEVKRGILKSREGIVVSDKMTKTVVVAITRQVKHAAYGKYIRKTNKCFAHDEKEICSVGDLVRIVETRPLSKNKSWRVKEIVRKASE